MGQKSKVLVTEGARFDLSAYEWDDHRFSDILISNNPINTDQALDISRFLREEINRMDNYIITMPVIEKLIENKLLEFGLTKPSPVRLDKSMFVKNGLALSENARRVLERRYLKKDNKGQAVETAAQMFLRVARHIAKAESNYGDDAVCQEMEKRFFKMMSEFKFLPNSPTLMNAGRELGQLAACFVLPVEDSMEGIFESLKSAALVHKSGGGTGFSFSRLRPKDSRVGSTGGVASGPVSFMRVYNTATEQVKQGGCLVPNTLVHTAEGLLYLDEICDPDKQGWQNHQLKVATDEGLKNSSEAYNHGSANTLLVKTRDGFELCGTPNHRVKIFDGKGLIWRKLKDLRSGDKIYTKLGQHHGNGIKLNNKIEIEHPNQNDCKVPDKFTDEFAFWLGYLFGDGFVADGEKDYRVGMSVNNDSYLFEKIEKITENIFGVSMTKYTKENDNSTSFVINNKKLKMFLAANGLIKKASGECSIPLSIRKSSPKIVGAFLKGLFEADGSITHNYPALTSVSEKMVKEVSVLLRGLGIPNKITVKPASASKFGDKANFVISVLSYVGLKQYIEKIGFDKESRFAKLNLDNVDLSREKNFTLPNSEEIIQQVIDGITEPQKSKEAKGKNFTATNPALRKSLLRYLRGDKNFTASSYLYYTDKYAEFRDFAPALDFSDYYDEVAEVQQTDENLTLDLSVDDNHTYLANGFVTHNTRRGANMAILRADHPDIMEFIFCKSKPDELNNFNISVGMTAAFMEAVKSGTTYNLIAPHNKEKKGVLNAREVYQSLVQQAWKNGDPGIIFLDRLNEGNPTPELGEIESTNPCGETPLLSYEACVLGSINLLKFVVNNGEEPTIDFDGLRDVIHSAVRFLDNTIDRSEYPISEIKRMVRGNRKIGLGLMGFADMLYRLKIPYNSDQGVEIAEKMMRFIQNEAHQASKELAAQRGVFDNFEKSVFKNQEGSTYRNATMTTIAPTGTLSIIADCSSGIEPLFALSFVRNVMDNDKLPQVNPCFEKVARERGFYSEELMETIARKGSIQDMSVIPEDVRRVFVTAHDISPEWHVRMQAAFQKYTDNAVSKCVAKGTYISTNKGVIPIEELGAAVGDNKFDEPLDDLFVIDENGNRKKVVSHYSGGIKPTVKMHFANGSIKEMAITHKLKTLNGWRRADEIHAGDMVLCRKETINDSLGGLRLSVVDDGAFKANAHKVDIPKNMTVDFAKWLGMVVADGHLKESSGLVGIHEKNNVVGKLFDELTLKIFGLANKTYQDDRNDVICHHITSRVLVRWLRDMMGYRSHDKYIPRVIMQGSVDEQIAFLEGVTLDGYVKRNRLVIYEGKSSVLAKQLYSMTYNLGLNPYLGTKKVISYDYYMYGIEIDNGIVGIEKHKQIERWRRKPKFIRTPESVFDMVLPTDHPEYSNLRYLKQKRPDYVWDYVIDKLDVQYDKNEYCIKVKSVEFSKNEVYDIEVEGTHSYLIDGIVSHNTVNMPHDATVEDVMEVYNMAYELGCKGVTIYRDGSKTHQVLSYGEKSEKTEAEDKFKTAVKERPEILEGFTSKISTGMGQLYVTVTEWEGQPFEVFATIGKSGRSTTAKTEAIGRLISLSLRAGVKVDKIIDQLKGIGGEYPVFRRDGMVLSIPDAISRVLEKKYCKNINAKNGSAKVENSLNRAVCPECKRTISFEEGCLTCHFCGFSKCG